jgi:hypothetical protein
MMALDASKDGWPMMTAAEGGCDYVEARRRSAVDAKMMEEQVEN